MIQDNARSRLNLLFLLLCCLVLGTTPVSAQVVSTSEWVNFYSSNTTLDAQPIPVGAVIDVYDPDSVHCGTFTVTTEGQYGFLLVYRDDVITPDVDEGAQPGDTLTFEINGLPARTFGPAAPVWTFNGDVLEMDLGTNRKPAQVDSLTQVTIDENDSAVVVADLDTVYSDPDGDSLLFSSQSLEPAIWDTVDLEHRLILTPAPGWHGEGRIVLHVDDGWDIVHDTIRVIVRPANVAPSVDLPDTLSFLEDTTDSLALDLYVKDENDADSTLHWSFSGNKIVVISLDLETRTAVFSAPVNWYGWERVIFTVADSTGAQDQDTLVVTVLPVNDPPVIVGMPDSVRFANDSTVTVELNGYVADVDNPVSELKWSAQVLSPGGDSLRVEIEPGNLAVFTSNTIFVGRGSVLFTVQDDSQATDTGVMYVVVTPTGVGSSSNPNLPAAFQLGQNYPNPFNSSTTLEVRLPRRSRVTLTVFDAGGRRVATLLDASREAGTHRLVWEARGLGAGVYFVRMRAGGHELVRKMTYVP